MRLSDYEFDILYHIYKKPHITLPEISEIFQKDYRKCYYFPLIKRKNKMFNRPRFNNTINDLLKRDLIFFTPYNTTLACNDHGELLTKSDLLSKTDEMGYAFITTELGDATIEDRFRNGRMFWIPWIVTTFIALSDLLISLF